MSRWLERARTRADRDGGFTLIEIMVALTLVMIAAAASIPLLIVGMKAANVSKLNTQAKNLAQQRMESMRDLPFHVDRQNGPFVDLLDIYYTNASATTVTHTRAGETENGHWVSGGASSPDPSGAFYQVSVPSLAGYPTFSQKIDTQFLSVGGSALSVPSGTNYDNLTAGSDQPLSTLVAVTVITTWSDHGASHSYTSYTRISDSRGLTSSLTTQGSASYLRVSSAGPSGNALTVDVASADATGDLSTGSVAAADVRALEAHDAAGQDYEGATSVSTSPSGTTQASGFPISVNAGSNGDCGWVESGPTQYADVTADTSTNGLPKVPTDIDTASPPVNQATAQLTAGGNSCAGIFGFDNQSTSYSSSLMLDPDQPLVTINNAGGTSTIVSGSAWVNASASTAVPHTATSGANTSATKSLVLFPGATFTDINGTNNGLLKVKLTQASIACSSSVTGGVATQSATGSWSVSISYWSSTGNNGSPGFVTLPTYTWNSATDTGSADPLASINLSSIVVYQNGPTVLHLSDYISSWSTERAITENANSGLHQLDGIVSIATQPVRAGDIMSAVGADIGNLSCVADDNR